VKKIIFLVMVLSLLSCSAEKTAPTGANHGPESGGGNSVSTPGSPGVETGAPSIEIVPHEADRHSRLLLVVKGLAFGAGKIEWLVNGTPSAGSGYTFEPLNNTRGDTVQARAMINGKEVLSNVVEIKDTPPEFSRLKIMPEVFRPGDRLYVEAEAKDMDGDPVTISYEWTKNGASAGTDSTIGSTVKRGDKISVKITPYDGLVYGTPVTLSREIGNMPPTIVEDNTYNIDGGVFTHRCRATDPDGDTLTWSLKAAPSGMTIDPSTGLVTWRVPPEFTGKTSFTVSASDGHGGQSTQVMNFAVK
jgi:Bacterial Ig domain